MRLLKLETMVGSEVLHCTMITARLKDTPDYSVISYTWEDGEEKTPLVINGRTVLITKTLSNALVSTQYETKNYVWMDALSINRHDHTETETQIPRMAEIFQQAKHIFIWLNSERKSINCSIQHDENSKHNPVALGIALSQHNKHCILPNVQNIRHYALESSLAALNARVISRDDFAEDKATLQRLFSGCADDDFPMLSIALSTTLTSFRALTLTEIARVATLLMSTNSVIHTKDEFTRDIIIRGIFQGVKVKYLEDMLSGKWSEIFAIDDHGGVQFVRKSMLTFFRMFPVEGIDTKHRILADACLRELEFSITLADADRNVNGTRCSSCTTASELSSYAAQFGSEHYRLAQHLSPALSARFHRVFLDRVLIANHGWSLRQQHRRSECPFRCDSCSQKMLAIYHELGFVALEKAFEDMKSVCLAAKNLSVPKSREPPQKGQLLALGNAASKNYVFSSQVHDCSLKALCNNSQIASQFATRQNQASTPRQMSRRIHTNPNGKCLNDAELNREGVSTPPCVQRGEENPNNRLRAQHSHRQYSTEHRGEVFNTFDEEDWLLV